MIIFGIQMKTLTKYVAAIVYLLLYLSNTIRDKKKLYYIDNFLSFLYGPIFTVGICGFLINNFFHTEIRKRDNVHPVFRILGDIFGHILPLILMINYGPDKTDIPFGIYCLIVSVFFILLKNYLQDTYIGVPPILLLFIAPAISILAFYFKYIF